MDLVPVFVDIDHCYKSKSKAICKINIFGKNFECGLIVIFCIKSHYFSHKRFDERKILIFAGILIMFLGRIALFPIPGLKDIPTRNTSIATTSTDNENLSLNPLVISYQDEDEVHFDSFTSCKISSIQVQGVLD